MTTKNRGHLTAIDFMMMDIHRPMTDEEINETHSQARLDKSLQPIIEGDVFAAGVGSAPSDERPLDPLPENVVILDVATSHKLQIKRVLQAALDQDLDEVMVIGWRDGPIYYLSSDPSIGNGMYRLKLAEQFLLNCVRDRWDDGVPVTRDQPDEPA